MHKCMHTAAGIYPAIETHMPSDSDTYTRAGTRAEQVLVRRMTGAHFVCPELHLSAVCASESA